MSVSEAAVTGLRRDALVALRGALAAAVDAAEPRELASLAGRLVEVLREIDDLSSVGVVSPVDELAARAARRRADAAGL